MLKRLLSNAITDVRVDTAVGLVVVILRGRSNAQYSIEIQIKQGEVES